MELAEPELLLVDRLPHLPAGGGRDWLSASVAALRARGGAIVQAVSEAEELIGPADRALWIDDHTVVANGHGRSVIDARRRESFGLASVARR
jgi:hydroxymethylpyrimidine/phosphomethylpyrimidine kinase